MGDDGTAAGDENESYLDAALDTAVETTERLRDEARRALAAGEGHIDAAAVAEAAVVTLDALEDVRFRLIVRGTADGGDSPS